VLRRDFALSAILLASGAFAHREAHAQAAQAAANGGAVVIVGPDLHLYARTISGDLEIRDDWTRAAHDKIADALEARLQASARSFQFADQTASMEGRAGQVLRLHARVSAAALNAQQRDDRHAGASSRWSVGLGAREIADAYHADFALIVEGAGAYASRARDVMSAASDVHALALAAAGNAYSAAALGLRKLRGGDGGSYLRASLVDLASGDIVWIRQIDADDDDPRTPDGAARLVDALLEHAPL
jgi:hypothetical protein